MAEDFTFSIGADGDVTVRSWNELEDWLKTERAHWTWLKPGDGRTDRFGLANSIYSTWENVIAQIHSLKSQGVPLEHARQYLAPLASGPVLISSTKDGATVLDILSSAGDMPASFAAGFVKRQIGLNNASSPEDLMGALLTVIPDLRDPMQWSEHLRRERSNFRTATRSLIERVDREADERKSANAQLVQRASSIAKRIFDIRRSKWRDAQGEWQRGADHSMSAIREEASTAISSISATEQAYREFMKLKAPVEYWENKAEGHKTREKEARTRLYWYFPVTTGLLVAAFVGAGAFLLSHPDTQTSKAPLAVYVVVSGGLLLISTLAFWIGRLLTKLYLSEHHLRNDAEERATMTTTYLALTTEGAAADADRHIVLNALFRATPDGIVREDGPTDATVQGLLSKFAAR